MLVKHRIYISLLLLSLLPLALISLLTDRIATNSLEVNIVNNFQSLAREKADGIGRLLDERINEVRLIARHPEIIDVVKKANSRYLGRNESDVMEEIHHLDKAWITGKGKTELAETIATNELSSVLMTIQATRPKSYGEMFVTDKQGATVAMTKTLSDYYQADEYWWQSGLSYVESGAFLDDRGYDESVGTIVIGVVVPVLDDGEVIGVFKINFRVKAILEIVSGKELDQGYTLLLARSDGSVIIGSDENHPGKLEPSELQAINTDVGGIWHSEKHGRDMLAAYSPMKHRFSTRDSNNALAGVAGETTEVKSWYVIYELDSDIAFASLKTMRSLAITMGIGALALAILIGYLLSRAICGPLATLKRGTEIIGSGDLAHRISLKAKDEFSILGDSVNTMAKKLRVTLASRDLLNQEVAERKLAEVQLSRFKTTLDLTLDCVFMFNPETLKFFYVNRGGMQQVGYSFNELLEMTPLDLKPDYDEENFRKMCQPLIVQPEHALTFETLHRTKKGSLIPVEVSLQYVVPDAEEPRFVAIVRDITERKKQEDERAAHFDLVSNYQDTIVNIALNPAVMIGDEEVIYPVITKTVAKVMDTERVSLWMFEDKPVKGLRCIDLYERDINRHQRDTFIAASDYPNYFSALHEGRVIDASQANTDIRTSEFSQGYLKPAGIQSMLDAPISLEGKMVGVLCYESVGKIRNWHADDIVFAREVAAQVAQVISNSRRRHSEMELNETRFLLQDVINSMPSVLVTVDGEQRVTQWSKEAIKLSGLDADSALGMKLKDALPVCEELMQRVLALVEDHRSHTLLRQECLIAGKKQFFDIAIYPLSSNEMEGTVLRLDFVTERVQIESMMSQTEKMMSIGGLAAGMAHELNNPLGGILQGLQNIKRRFSPELPKNVETAEALGLDLEKVRQYMDDRQIARFIENIGQSSAHAADIVANLVKFIRHPEAGMMAENLPKLIDSTVELALLDYDMKKKYGFREMKIEREYDSELMSVPCVASEIQQVLLNALRNAAQAVALQVGRSEAGQITIRTKKVDNMACIEIEDNGPGLDESTRNRVFEPFFTTRDPGVGTGLGLSVSYYIVHDQHKGSMHMESTPGKGAKLIIELPLDV